jgi:hypothetical protein
MTHCCGGRHDGDKGGLIEMLPDPDTNAELFEDRASSNVAGAINNGPGLSRQFDMVRWTARAVVVTGLAAAAALVIVACGGASNADPSSPLGFIDQATRTVQLNLFITESNFNGYSGGELTMRMPQGWRVDVYCSNQASTPQSCAIVSGTGSTTPAFSGADSPDPVAGLPAGTSWNFSFLVTRVGSYRLASLTPAHHDNMWDRFDVVATGEPSVSISGAGPPNSLRELQARLSS